jgi:hypothetical protein
MPYQTHPPKPGSIHTSRQVKTPLPGGIDPEPSGGVKSDFVV